MVLICISLMISDVENLFIYMLAICMSSLEKRLFIFLAHSVTGSLVSLLLSCRSSLCILEINPLSETWFPDTFSHYICCLSLFCFLCYAEAFQFNAVPLVCFGFRCLIANIFDQSLASLIVSFDIHKYYIYIFIYIYFLYVFCFLCHA